MTDQEAVVALRRSNKDFAKSLVSQIDTGRGLSPKQWPWVHTLAEEQIQREQKGADELREVASSVEAIVQDESQMDGIFKLFQHAKEKLSFPKIRLAIQTPDKVRHYLLTLASEQSKSPGSIFVKCRNGEMGNQYVGKISTDGLFIPGSGVVTSSHPGLVDQLAALAENPVRVAMEYGRLLGQCCLCGLTLTDPRSIDAGIGPVCAKNYGISYGSIKRHLKMSESGLVEEVA